MAEKKSFLLFVDRRRELDLLSDEQAGQFIKAVYQYADTGVIPDVPDIAVKMMLSIVFTQIDAANERWEQTKKKRSEAGKKSGEARRNKSGKCKTNVSGIEQTRTKRTSVPFVEQTRTKRTDTVTDTVTVSNSTNSTITYTQDSTAPYGAVPPAQNDEVIPWDEIDFELT
jgi:hypothetical protein